MTEKRIVQSVVLLALLIAASLAVGGLWSHPAALAQEGEPSPAVGVEPQATPPPGGVDPFEMALTAHKDSWVDQAHPDTNYGTDLELHLNPGSHIGARTLLSFDLSALPPGATIVDATLAVYSDDTASDPYPISPYAITSTWKESLVTWNNKPSTSQRGDPASQHVPEGWTEFDVSNIVQEWYDGSLAVYGIALIPEAAASGERIYQASNSATPPVLTVHYTRRTELIAVADTWVEVAHPSLAHGSYPTLNIASATFSGQEAHTLLAFDFASLPADIDIISATLSLFSIPNQALAEDATLVADLYADAILGAWSESATTWNNAPASLSLGDPATQLVVGGYTPWDVTNIVQSWADGDLDAHGILLRASTATSSSYGFWSRDLSMPPRLVIVYGAAPPDCNPITSVQISGASAGVTGVAYTFDSVYFPADADPPYNIRWSATDQGADHYGSSVTFTWDSPGEKEVYVAMSHCGGETSTSHTITISDPDPGCDYPLADVSLGGPLVVAKNTAETFAAGASPSNATLPITFLWEATDQAPEPMIVNTRTTYNDYTWPTAGSKTISVTAENCAGSATAYQAVQVVDPVNLPDLFISTAWIAMDEGRIYYVMHNGGNTAVPAGVYVGLRVGPNTVATAEHPQPLAPGGLGVGYLDYAWTCAGTTASVAVEADWGEDIAETDESNNSWTSIWTCDQRPPEFVSGPEVVDITETRVRVEWTMDEACVGWVEYDTSVYDPVPFQEQDSTAYLTSHDVTLTGLTAGTTYYARALCEDAAGLGVNSQAVTFDTAPPGSDPPVIHTLTLEQAPHAYYEFWQAVVEVEDGSFMDRVACSLDGTSLGVDYSPDTDGAYPRYLLYLSPYDLGLTRDQVFGQPHQLICTAYRQDPSAFTTQQQTVGFPGDPAPPPYLWIEEPHPYYKIFVPGSIVPAGTQLDVVVSAAAHEWACTASGFSGDLPPGLGPVKCDDLAPLPVDSVELWFDGALKDTVTPGPSDTVHTLTADLTATVLGEYEYRVAATVGARTDEDSRSLVVEQGQAGVDVTRSVRREGNLLKVTLDVENNGTVDAIIPRIVDRAFGLQPILGSYDLGDVRYNVEISGVDWYENTGGRDLDIRLNFYLEQPNGESRLRLAPGASTSVSYMLVPELHEIDTPARLGKGWHVNYPNTIAEYLDVWVYGPQGFQPQSIDLSETLVNDPAYGMLPLNDAIAHAIRTADYVLVTSPHAIYAYMAEQGDEVPDDDAERLFSNMAELASLESGVLGFLRHAYTQPLDDLLEPGNDSWSDRLAPSFEEVDKGYVLIVGETEIVAAHYVGEDNLVTYAGIPDHVHDSDLWYAHTAGSTARPELVVGRVIGNDLDVLNTYLDNILRALRGEAGYGFFRSRAYVCNGNGSGEWTFQDDGEQVDNQLDVRYDTSTWRNFMGDDDEAQKAIHLQLLPDRDLVLYRGHGNQDAWDDGLLASDVLAGVYDLGDRNPAMLAAACKTGNYETQNDLNLAEVLLAQGAGTYVGATEISERWANSDAFVNLVPKWQADESMGQALNQVKRKIWGMEWAFDNRKLWAYEYNLYGDPKYASMEAATTAAEDETLVVTAEPQGVNLLVNLPDLEARLVDGDHVVQIPGGGTLAELGAYPVPVWTLSLDFRPGQQVQDVQLVNRAGMVVTGSLSLPVVTAEIDCGCVEAAATPDSAVKGWYPTMDQAFAWSVEKQPNGASTLQIVLYPFHYHSATGDAIYYRSYKLSVATLDASAQVESLRVTGRGYDPGDRVPLALVLDSEARQDLVVQPSVRTLGTNKVLGGLPMRTLHAVAGTATVDLTWNTHGYGAGDYQIVVELLDPDGQRLDTAVAEVTLGRAGARLTSLTASQDYFGPGDQIGLALTVQNTGTLSLDGTAVFQVQRTGDLSVTQTLTVPVRGLAPGASKKVSATWDTTGAEARRYRVIGTFKFYSQATDPRDLVLYRPTVYLPVVTRIP